MYVNVFVINVSMHMKGILLQLQIFYSRLLVRFTCARIKICRTGFPRGSLYQSFHIASVIITICIYLHNTNHNHHYNSPLISVALPSLSPSLSLPLPPSLSLSIHLYTSLSPSHHTMRINLNTTIVTDKLVLVPYREEHVPEYHRWMQDPFLQEMTESEPLSVKEENEMQRTWRDSEDKCTFILLDPSRPDTEGTGRHGGGMIGDVNLFWSDLDEPSTAEIEVMIGVGECRGRGLAPLALCLMMAYGLLHLKIDKFRAKILDHNEPSIKLFRDKLGFKETKRVAVFHEVHFELEAPQALDLLQERGMGLDRLTMGTYDEPTSTTTSSNNNNVEHYK